MPSKPPTDDQSKYPAFAVAVDLVILTIREDALHVLLVKRGVEPYAARWALPGGFVHEAEDLDAAARRELVEETSVHLDAVHLEQLATYGKHDRDPRMRVVSVAYLALASELPEPTAGSDAAAAEWRSAAQALRIRPRLAFDHNQILRAGLERARAKLEYTTLATAFCAEPFTMSDLRRVYEIVWGAELDPRNFHRKVRASDDFVVAVPAGRAVGGRGRPAQLFRAGRAERIHPPLLRP